MDYHFELFSYISKSDFAKIYLPTIERVKQIANEIITIDEKNKIKIINNRFCFAPFCM